MTSPNTPSPIHTAFADAADQAEGLAEKTMSRMAKTQKTSTEKLQELRAFVRGVIAGQKPLFALGKAYVSKKEKSKHFKAAEKAAETVEVLEKRYKEAIAQHVDLSDPADDKRAESVADELAKHTRELMLLRYITNPPTEILNTKPSNSSDSDELAVNFLNEDDEGDDEKRNSDPVATIFSANDSSIVLSEQRSVEAPKPKPVELPKTTPTTSQDAATKALIEMRDDIKLKPEKD